MNPDLGYFGPDSVTWRVHAEPVTMIGGGLRALLLQALHPDAMALINAHNPYCEGPSVRNKIGTPIRLATPGTT